MCSLASYGHHVDYIRLEVASSSSEWRQRRLQVNDIYHYQMGQMRRVSEGGKEEKHRLGGGRVEVFRTCPRFACK